MNKRMLLSAVATLVFMATGNAQDAKRLRGADLFIDLQQYAGKQVIIIDAEIYGAGNDGALLKSGGNNFKVTTEGIDRETFRHFLDNCTGLLADAKCKAPILATPTGAVQQISKLPILKNVKITQ